MIDSCVLTLVRQPISASFVVPLLFLPVSCPLALISIRHALCRGKAHVRLHLQRTVDSGGRGYRWWCGDAETVVGRT